MQVQCQAEPVSKTCIVFGCTKSWLMTPEWDGTLPSHPKNPKTNPSCKGCHIILDKAHWKETTVSGFQSCQLTFI
jgi:hypothetical protein